jgi:nucleoid-associated protein EbfC
MNIMKMMQQAKAMQGKMADMQAKMESVIVEGASGGGAVRVQMTCKGSCVSVAIEQSALDDKEMAEDLIKLAINDAKAKADAKLADETQKMMSELGLPPGAMGAGGLPF